MPGGASGLASGAAAFLYGGTAVAISFVNKAVLSVYGFKQSNVVLLVQMLAAVAGIFALRARGVVDSAPLTLARLDALIPVASLYCANAAFALASLEGLSVPVYTTLKRLTPALVLAVHTARGHPPALAVAASVALTLAGCVMAGAGDLAFEPRAYGMAGASCALQAAYMLTVERVKPGCSSVDLMLYNALLSVPMLLLLCIVTGELRDAASAAPALLAARDGFGATLAACLALGVLLNYAQLLCVRVCGALTTTLVGVLKSALAVALGFVLLGGIRDAPPLHVGGMVVATCGGSWYAMLEHRAGGRGGSGSSGRGPWGGPSIGGMADIAEVAEEGSDADRTPEKEPSGPQQRVDVEMAAPPRSPTGLFGGFARYRAS